MKPVPQNGLVPTLLQQEYNTGRRLQAFDSDEHYKNSTVRCASFDSINMTETERCAELSQMIATLQHWPLIRLRDELDSWVARHVKLMNSSEAVFSTIRVPIEEKKTLNKHRSRDSLRRLMQDNAKLKRFSDDYQF